MLDDYNQTIINLIQLDTLQGDVTYTPRLIAFDLKGKFDVEKVPFPTF